MRCLPGHRSFFRSVYDAYGLGVHYVPVRYLVIRATCDVLTLICSACHDSEVETAGESEKEREGVREMETGRESVYEENRKKKRMKDRKKVRRKER